MVKVSSRHHFPVVPEPISRLLDDTSYPEDMVDGKCGSAVRSAPGSSENKDEEFYHTNKVPQRLVASFSGGNPALDDREREPLGPRSYSRDAVCFCQVQDRSTLAWALKLLIMANTLVDDPCKLIDDKFPPELLTKSSTVPRLGQHIVRGSGNTGNIIPQLITSDNILAQAVCGGQ